MSDAQTAIAGGTYFPDLVQVRHLDSVLSEVARRRREQDDVHGGLEHDDLHTLEEWLILIDRYASCVRLLSTSSQEKRDYLLDVAALAVAALQSLDRKEQEADRGQALPH